MRQIFYIIFLLYTTLVFSQVSNLPDNVQTLTCDPVEQGKRWGMSIQQSLSGFGGYTGLSPIFVGDLDADNLPELVTVRSDYRNNGACFMVLKGGDYSQRKFICFGKNFGTPSCSFGYASGPVALAKLKTGSGKEIGLIFVVVGTPEAKLLKSYIYHSITDIRLFQETTLNQNFYGNPGVVDFNHDGRPEVYIGNEVFDAYSLQLIGRGADSDNVGQHLQHDGAIFMMSSAADVLPTNEGIELVCGNQIYAVSSNGVQLLMTVGGTKHDGSAQVVDFNGDGYLDVLVRNTSAVLSLFSPATNEVLFEHSPYKMSAYPAVGDIDGDGQVEIVGLKNSTKMSAYRYDAKNKCLAEFWQVSHSDVSAQTSMSLFDFNADGIQEIVYRDETSLRIINGSGKSHCSGEDTLRNGYPCIYNLAKISLSSVTKSEYPVVADVDGDNEAEILISGQLSGVSYENGEVGLNIFTSKYVPWASARPVWNQYHYDVVNVNKDLTIPQFQFNKSELFPNGIRVFNNAQQQSTNLSPGGNSCK